MNTSKFTFLLVLFAFLIASCEDIIEEDIKNRQIVVVHPPNNFQTTNQTILFWWNEVDGADNYQISVAEGGFASLRRLVVDSTVSGTQFIFTFRPGIYEWRIRAINSVSSSDYFHRTFQVDTTSDLNGVVPILAAPLDGTISSDSMFTFRWNEIFGVDNYLFEIRSPDVLGATLVMDTIAGNLNSHIKSSLPEGNHVWGIKALNKTSSSQTTWFGIELDHTKPKKPSLGSSNLSQNGDSITLNWTSGVDKNFDFDSLYIYSDAAETNIVTSELVRGNTFVDTTLGSGTFYWQVKTIDKAGNIGDFVDSKSFTK